MIFFYCPECREDLEADEEIRGTRMSCPACLKEIEVPQVGIKVERRRGTESAARMRRHVTVEEGFGGLTGQFVVVILISSVAVIALLFVLGAVIRSQHDFDSRPDCGTCQGKGTMDCTKCGASGRERCGNCNGTGQITNWKGDPETCQPCGGSSSVPCAVCGGRGRYSCLTCFGSGKVDS